MERKFKLIKSFPNSPELNIVVKLTPHDRYVGENCNLNKDYVENYPEFWEEMIPKEYEILSYKYKDTLVTKRDNGNYLSTEWKGKAIGATWEEVQEFWIEGEHNIHSVKRLSDGEIFSVGDKVVRRITENCPNPSIIIRTISSFHYNFENYLCFEDENGEKGFRVDLFAKVVKPLFTTEDGVDIYRGDTYCKVNNQSDYSVVTGFIAEGAQDNYKGLKFSTKERAEEYIKLNKPKYSLNDLVKVANRYAYIKNVDAERILKNVNL